MHSSNWMCVFLLAVHVFTHVLVDCALFKSSQFVHHNVTLGLVVLTFILSGGATIIVRARHARAIVNDRKKQTRQTYGRTDFWFLDIMLKDWWDTNALLVGVSSYGFRIMGVASDNFDTTVFLNVKCLFILVYPWWNKQQEIFHLHHHYILRQFNTHIP